jgi:serine/threonine protein kinase
MNKRQAELRSISEDGENHNI